MADSNRGQAAQTTSVDAIIPDIANTELDDAATDDTADLATSTSKTTAEPTCGGCGGCGSETGKGGKPLSKCTGCKVQKYCSKQCQKQDWSNHKAACKASRKNAEQGRVVFSQHPLSHPKLMPTGTGDEIPTIPNGYSGVMVSW